ncbi:rod shape-determining protein MreD [Thermoproteota archaeon]
MSLFYISAIICAFLEAAFFNHVPFFSVKPNLILLLVTLFCFYFNFDILRVMLFCLFCGLLKDSFSVVPFGIHMLVYLFIGAILSYIARNFLRYNWRFIIPLFVFATLSQGIIYALLRFVLFGSRSSLFVVSFRVLVPEVIYGLFIFLLFFKVIKRCVIDKLS